MPPRSKVTELEGSDENCLPSHFNASEFQQSSIHQHPSMISAAPRHQPSSSSNATFVFHQLRDDHRFLSFKDIEDAIYQHWSQIPDELRPNIINLLSNMKVKGIQWANIAYDAYFVRSDEAADVIKAKLKKFDEWKPSTQNGRGFNRRGRGNNSGRSRGNFNSRGSYKRSASTETTF